MNKKIMNKDKIKELEDKNKDNIIKKLKKENKLLKREIKNLENENDVNKLKDEIKKLKEELEKKDEENYLNEVKIQLYDKITLYDIIDDGRKEQNKEDFDEIFQERIFKILKPLFLNKYKEIITNNNFYKYIKKHIRFNLCYIAYMNKIRQILYELTIFDIFKNNKDDINDFINKNREDFNNLYYDRHSYYDCIYRIYDDLFNYIKKNKIIENNIKIKNYIEEDYTQ